MPAEHALFDERRTNRTKTAVVILVLRYSRKPARWHNPATGILPLAFS